MVEAFETFDCFVAGCEVEVVGVREGALRFKAMEVLRVEGADGRGGGYGDEVGCFDISTPSFDYAGSCFGFRVLLENRE